MKRKRFIEEHAAGRVAGHERSQDETLCLQDFRTGPHARPRRRPFGRRRALLRWIAGDALQRD